METETQRVLQVLWSGEYGGAERSVLDLASALDPSLFEVRCVLLSTSGWVGRELKRRGVSTICLRWTSAYSVMGRLKLLRELRAFRPAIIHEHGVPPGTRPLLRCVAPLVSSEHGRLIELIETRKRLALLLTRLEQRLVDVVVVYSNFMARRICEQDALSSESVRVVRHGIDLSLFDPTRVVQERTGSSEFRIGFVGRIVNAQKGVDCLIRAISHLSHDERSRIQVFVAGDGPDRVANEGLIHALGLGREIEFVGWCDDVASFLCQLDLLVVPSRTETFGLVAIEALAMGVRVVAFDTGGLSEIGKECEHVTLVAAEDTIGLAMAISNCIQECKQIPCEEARRYVSEHFDLRRCATAMQDVYTDVLRQHR